MGKWSALKGQVPAAPVDVRWQQKVDVAKNEYLHFTTADKAREYCKLRNAKDQKEEEIHTLNTELEALQQMMIAEMEAQGTDLFRLDTGESLAIKDDPYVSVADRDEFIAWIKETGQEDLLTVHYMTLSSMTKERLQSGQNAPPGLKVFLKQSITRYRARG